MIECLKMCVCVCGSVSRVEFIGTIWNLIIITTKESIEDHRMMAILSTTTPPP